MEDGSSVSGEGSGIVARAPGQEAAAAPGARGPGGTGEGTAAPGSMVRLMSGDFVGIEGRPVEVQVDVSSRGSPGFIIVGLPGKSIRESRERIRAAIRNCGLKFPFNHRILVNLAPASSHKEGSGFDLAMALGILLATRQVSVAPRFLSPAGLLEWSGFLGELGLNGELRPVAGALLTSAALAERGITSLWVPAEHGRETALVEGLQVFPARDLHEAIGMLEGRAPPAGASSLAPEAASRGTGLRSRSLVDGFTGEATPDLVEVCGQEATKRGLLLAAAGAHNVLLSGPPGVGKTMLARRLPGILPPMTFAEAMEVMRIASAVGQGHWESLAEKRPFRAPHHTISYSGLVGGGSRIQPGEVTRAHAGVLFLDELPEFNRRALEALREPLESGHITIGRSSGSILFPARFMLVGAMNPCPCGYSGHPRRACKCTARELSAYRQRLSAPLLDRLDLFIEVTAVRPGDLLEGGGVAPPLSSAALLRQSLAARALQERRWGRGLTNGQVPLTRLLKEGHVRRQALERLRASAERLGLSARGFGRSLRVARTIADVGGSPGVEVEHVQEALHYRSSI